MEDELYSDEVNASGNMEQGRNAYTGYWQWMKIKSR
jgi:hypothetical protein